MRITILTNGSRGDVQPFLALAVGLNRSGFEACLAAPAAFKKFIQDYGVEFMELDDRPDISERIHPANALGRITSKAAVIERISERALEICEKSDALVFRDGSYLKYPILSIAEKLNLPYLEGSLLPLLPTRAYPNIYITNRADLPGWVNWLSHQLFRKLTWWAFWMPVNRLRRNRLGLKPLSPIREETSSHPVLHGFSAAILPKPADWPQNALVTGYWTLEPLPTWKAQDELLDFLEIGPPPVYLGFGSMEAQRNAAFWQGILGELKSKGFRVVFAADPELFSMEKWQYRDLHLLKEAPHDWLFPRMSAVAHHGGAGTTGASFRSGVPAVVLPHKYDQLFWGQIVNRLDAGPSPIPVRKVNPEKLSASIQFCLTDTHTRRRAAEIGRALRAENGVASAVDQIRKYLTKG